MPFRRTPGERNSRPLDFWIHHPTPGHCGLCHGGRKGRRSYSYALADCYGAHLYPSTAQPNCQAADADANANAYGNADGYTDANSHADADP